MLNEFTYKSKEELRRELTARRRELTDKPRREQCAVRRLSPLLKGNVMVYVSMGSELCTHGLIEELLARDDVVVYAPYTVGDTIEPRRVACVGAPNKYGNMPADCYAEASRENSRERSIKLDYCVTPLLGFNREGHRIGYGKGCYDRFFARCEAVKIGLAFDAQFVDFVPSDDDVPLDCCVTEKKVIYFSHAGNSR